VLASQVKAQVTASSTPGALALRIESSRSVYPVGDSIKLRVTLRNTLGESLKVPYGAVTDLIQLYVYDMAGNQLKHESPRWPVVWRGPRERTWGPWREVTFKGKDGTEWIDLWDWGYDLPAAGRYIIVGIPLSSGPPESLADTAHLARITITVQP
jgi:hypothetical protein